MDIAQTRRCVLSMHRPNLDVSYRFDGKMRAGLPLPHRRLLVVAQAHLLQQKS